MTMTLRDLEKAERFADRHIGPAPHDQAVMLAGLGLDSLDALIERTVPASIRLTRPLDLPPAVGEHAALAELRAIAGQNRVLTSLIGMGYHGTHTPPVILRNLLENPGWYTAYTPYQAEVSQGRLEALLNFQQMVCDLTGMEVANASLLDEATAAAEGMAMARRIAKRPGEVFFVDADTHPQTLAVLRTRARNLGFELVVGDPAGELPASLFGALLSYPGSSGRVRDIRPMIERIHAAGAQALVATDLLALALLTPPGEMGADIVLGSAQRFGVPMGYGGPHAAFFATRDAHKRSMPGRLIGVSKDAQGRVALRMALQTREQHIRREKATSNICTAQVLLAVIAGFYAVWHGPEGIRAIALRTHRLAQVLATGLRRAGLAVETEAFFDTLTLHVPGRAAALVAAALERGINLRPIDADRLGIALDETTTRDHVATLLDALAGVADADLDALDAESGECLPPSLRRRSAFLTHPVFTLHRSETEMLRYLRRLQAKDIALDRAMIPLGSCTMKLNAAAEMIPVTWPEFGALHPFVPADQARGYRILFAQLERWLAEITGFAAVSLQPNAGSQGEYAGLLTIKAYHAANGEAQRDICLIPASAHGTNPASAAMAGLKVVVVGCDERGNVDVDDLRRKLAEHGPRVAALMITYPSTHGVFEAGIREICDLVHAAGGQVYMDGANLNAQVGLCRPGDIGADVSHINLHKTFCIPHGGGGPGMGPIGVAAHLAPFLPDHPVVAGVNPAAAPGGTIGAVAAAPWSSASILPISWMYIRMMGADGLKRATEVAILAANHIAHRLAPHYPVLYRGDQGMVAHECILDLRPLTDATGITAEDVAKRLIDYGFHAPTMSFPVAGTLMIEPTESESLTELERFCEAMIAIRGEIAEVESGVLRAEDSPLRHAPHTADLLLGERWERRYGKERAFFPSRAAREDKFWPPVGRVDNVFGDRHVVCSCPPIGAYLQAAE